MWRLQACRQRSRSGVIVSLLLSRLRPVGSAASLTIPPEHSNILSRSSKTFRASPSLPPQSVKSIKCPSRLLKKAHLRRRLSSEGGTPPFRTSPSLREPSPRSTENAVVPPCNVHGVRLSRPT